MAADDQWAALADLEDEGEQRDAILAYLTSLTELAPGDLEEAVGSFLTTEGEASGFVRKRLVLGRFHAWLKMPPAAVTAMAANIATARDAMEGPEAMGSTTGDQAAARDLSLDEVTRLVAILPAFRSVLSDDTQAKLDGATDEASAVAQPRPAAGPRRPFWRFWDRG